ncbi:hypothetical protein [Bacillus sp. FSL K6-6540]|uniref:hypothetical protein n=1 Tax=Bacillus sp. FSL K6-6540 TaxID=2921512 RepID=UPI0030FAD374
MVTLHKFIGKFSLGAVFATPGVFDLVSEEERIRALTRHHNGDWGDVSEEDSKSNDEALENGGRLLSAYVTAKGDRFWIITEADRSSTTFLLPEEY